MLALNVGTDTLLWLRSLKDVVARAYVATASVTASVVDTVTGSTVATVPLNYVAGSYGDYRGTLEDTTALVDGRKYKVRIVAVLGSTRATFEDEAVASYYRGLP